MEIPKEKTPWNSLNSTILCAIIQDIERKHKIYCFIPYMFIGYTIPFAATHYRNDRNAILTIADKKGLQNDIPLLNSTIARLKFKGISKL